MIMRNIKHIRHTPVTVEGNILPKVEHIYQSYSGTLTQQTVTQTQDLIIVMNIIKHTTTKQGWKS